MTLLTMIRSRIRTYANNSYIWLAIYPFKKGIQLTRNICSLIDAELRKLMPELPQIGNDHDVDLVVERVARTLTNRPSLPEFDSIKNNKLVVELSELADKSASLKLLISRYHAAEAYLADQTNDLERKTKELTLARLATPEIKEFETKDVYRENAQTLARLKRLRKELAERSAVKVNLSLSAISGLIPLISAVFLSAGFLYVRFFYQKMGIDASLYFSIGDYFAASAEQIRSGIFAAIPTLFAFVYGVRDRSLQSQSQTRALTTSRKQIDKFLVVAITLSLSISAYLLYVDKPDFYQLKFEQLRFTGLFASFMIASWIAKSFFSNRLTATIVFIGLIVFSLDVAISVFQNSEQFLKGKKQSTITEVFLKNDTSPFEATLFGANSSYYFFYSQSDSTAYVIPKEKIEKILVKKK